MELAEAFLGALAGPAGARPELLQPVIEAAFTYKLGRVPMNPPEKFDADLRHLTGGATWAGALLATKEPGMAHDALLAAGFRDATLEQVEALAARNDIPMARILHARAGRDSAADLRELSQRATKQRLKHSAVVAAIAAGDTSPGIEDGLNLHEVSWVPLVQAGLEKLGVARATAVFLTELRRYDGTDYAEQVLPVCLQVVGVPLSDEALDALARRCEEVRKAKYESSGWEWFGELLARGQRWSACFAFVRAQLGRDPGWRRTMRGLLLSATRAGVPIEPAHDEFIDPAQAANEAGHDTWKSVTELLKALPPERRHALLEQAAFNPRGGFRFLLPDLPASWLQKLAAEHVAARELADAKDFLIATRLKELGPGFVDALKVALADVKPKAAYLKALQRNLAPEGWAELEKWLAERPEPAPAKKPAKRKSS